MLVILVSLIYAVLFCMVIHTNYDSVDDVLYEHSHFEFYLDENLIFFNGDDFSVIAVFCLTLYNSLTLFENG
jgi:hypothetical protein